MDIGEGLSKRVAELRFYRPEELVSSGIGGIL